jgi:hypothetical protein
LHFNDLIARVRQLLLPPNRAAALPYLPLWAAPGLVRCGPMG